MKKYNVFQNIGYMYKRMFKVCPGSWFQVVLNVLARIGNPVLASLIPSIALSLILKGNVVQYIWVIMLVFIANLLLMTVEAVSKNNLYFAITASTNFEGGLVPSLMDKANRTDFSNIDSHQGHRILHKAFDAVNEWGGAMGILDLTMDLLGNAVGIVTYGAAICLLDWKIFAVVVAAGVANYILVAHAQKFFMKERETILDTRAKWRYIRNHSQPEYGKDIRIYQMQNWLHDTGIKLINKIWHFNNRCEVRWYYPTISDQLFLVARDLLAFFILVSRVYAGSMTIPEMIVYTALISNFTNWFSFIAYKVGDTALCSAEVSNYREFMESEDKFLHTGSGDIPDTQNGLEITFDHVSFRYADDMPWILKDLSFTIKKGEKLALVGNNGAGKTTIVKLICGLYPVTEGRILANGVDISTLNIDEYQKQLSVVFQELNPLAFTVRENVSGKENEKSDLELVKKCLSEAGILEKIEKLPAKEDSYISEQLDPDGTNFSGGETQKLLLARALYKNGSILVLDEPTSALDALAESHIYNEYNKMAENKTALFISHRLASTKFCSRIFYLQHGQVLEEGTHEELLAKNGEYAHMFEIQSHYYRENVEADKGDSAETGAPVQEEGGEA